MMQVRRFVVEEGLGLGGGVHLPVSCRWVIIMARASMVPLETEAEALDLLPLLLGLAAVIDQVSQAFFLLAKLPDQAVALSVQSPPRSCVNCR